MNRFNSLKHIQHFDLHNSNQKMTGKKERKKHYEAFWKNNEHKHKSSASKNKASKLLHFHFYLKGKIIMYVSPRSFHY